MLDSYALSEVEMWLTKHCIMRDAPQHWSLGARTLLAIIFSQNKIRTLGLIIWITIFPDLTLHKFANNDMCTTNVFILLNEARKAQKKDNRSYKEYNALNHNWSMEKHRNSLACYYMSNCWTHWALTAINLKLISWLTILCRPYTLM